MATERQPAEAKSPAFQCYPKDLLVDTMTMTAEQFGAYWRLICVSWIGLPGCKQGELPVEDRELAAISGVPEERWQEIKAPVVRCFTKRRNRYTQKRVQRELASQAARRVKKQRAASARWHGTSPDAPALQVHMQSQCPSSSSSSALPTTTEASPPAQGAPADAPLSNQQQRVKAVLDLWEGMPEGLHPEPGFVALWLKGWSDDEALLRNLVEIKATNAFHRGAEFVASMLRTRWQNGKKPPPPLKGDRREPEGGTSRYRRLA